MKLVVRALSVLAALALATPAFACDGAKKTTMAKSEKAQTSQPTAQAEKKAETKAKTAQAQQQQVKPASAAN
jgi:hypothetical protein